MTSLHMLTNLSQHDYALLYNSVLQAIEKSLNNDQYHHLVEETIATLKKRRTYLLPIDADSETIYRQQEAWTYGVFIATLFYCYPKPIAIDVLIKFIPKQAWDWLKSYEPLYAELTAYLSGENNVFSKLVSSHEVIVKQEKEDAAKSEQIITYKAFFIWLQEQLNNGTCQYVHRIDLGYFIEMPKNYELFQKMTNNTSCQLEDIVQHPNIIKAKDEEILHHYCLGDWQQRQTLTGIIIKPSGLKQLRQELTIRKDLLPDPFYAID